MSKEKRSHFGRDECELILEKIEAITFSYLSGSFRPGSGTGVGKENGFW
ncbi:hypothetical protein [Coleofasciculus sp. FACHB-SPT9]|nr:hypothetical protein [Coleofasciculus sp. FACHB-SPT9]MBD1887992.1 hypothetical protein [Coleofasciculus sp. FACHB-SPT9]